MANMSPGERAQMERYDLQDRRDRLSRATEGQKRVWAGLTVVFLVILAALSYAAYQIFDGWPHLIVLADLIIIFFGLALWVNPRRKNV